MKVWVNLGVFLLFAAPITFFDIGEYRIPDVLTLSGLAIFAALKVFWEEEAVLMVVSEIVTGFGVFWLIRFLSKGRMGLGDAKYSALIAVSTGFLGWLVALVVASAAGLVLALVLIKSSRMRRSQRLPFAPFLSLGGAASLALQGLFPLIW